MSQGVQWWHKGKKERWPAVRFSWATTQDWVKWLASANDCKGRWQDGDTFAQWQLPRWWQQLRWALRRHRRLRDLTEGSNLWPTIHFESLSLLLADLCKFTFIIWPEKHSLWRKEQAKGKLPSTELVFLSFVSTATGLSVRQTLVFPSLPFPSFSP